MKPRLVRKRAMFYLELDLWNECDTAACAALDSKSELAVQAALEKVMAGRTTLVPTPFNLVKTPEEEQRHFPSTSLSGVYTNVILRGKGNCSQAVDSHGCRSDRRSRRRNVCLQFVSAAPRCHR